MRVDTRVLVRKKERSKLRGINPPANEKAEGEKGGDSLSENRTFVG
jgi:hypothetical protein